MIINNENEKLSRNRERRIERKIKMINKLKLFLKKNSSRKKKEN